MRDEPSAMEFCASRFELLRPSFDPRDASGEAVERERLALLESGEFDPGFYQGKAGLDYAADPVRHYLTKGWRLGLPHRPNFDASFLLPYYEAAGFPGPPALTAMSLRAAHWPVYGTRAAAEAVARIVRDSTLFDATAYRARLGGNGTRLDPALHFVLVGERLGLPPSRQFHPGYYYESYPDVAAAEICLLTHYLQHGQMEGRRSRPRAAGRGIDLANIASDKDCIVLATSGDETSKSARPALEIGGRLSKKYNLITLLLQDGVLAERFAAISAALIPLESEACSQIEIRYFLEDIQRQHPIRYALVAGLDCAEALAALILQFVPTVTLIDRAASLGDFVATRKALGYTAAALFSTEAIAASFGKHHPALLKGKLRVLSHGDLDQQVELVEEAGADAIATMRQRAEDFTTIRDDASFDAGLFLLTSQRTMPRTTAIAHYLGHWSAHRDAPLQDTPRYLRRPAQGFHPQIYAHLHPELGEIDPLAGFIRDGRPEGPWLHRVIRQNRRAGPNRSLRTAIQAHFHYPELIDDFLAALAPNVARCDLMLSTDEEAKAAILRNATTSFHRGRVDIEIAPNRGRDIGPLLTLFGNELLKNYDVVGHFHSKRSLTLDRAIGASWRGFLWEHLLGPSHPIMDVALATLAEDQRLGLIFAEDPHLCGWDANLGWAEELAARAGIDRPLPTFFEFPIGTMFWARTAALAPLIELNLAWNDYPEEPLPPDGVMLNGLERLLPFAARKAGFSFATVYLPGVTWSIYGNWT